MPDLVSGAAPVLLVGAGPMARAYAAVLTALETPFAVAGRGAASAAAFAAETGVRPGTGPLADQLAALPAAPRTAIVAASAVSLAEATRALLAAGVRRLLVEKPAALDPDGAAALAEAAEAAGAEAFVAYNRRFLASVLAAEAMIAEDGGPLSVKLDFTEATRRIEALDKRPAELAAWLYGNSTHVIDLAFHLGGAPRALNGISRGALSWHPSGAIFVGWGETEAGAALSWHADWLAPGRWGVEVMTARRRLILQPLEQLSVQDQSGFAVSPVALDDADDRAFKPGLLRQVAAFLAPAPDPRLLTLADHARRFTAYAAIRDGRVWP